MRRATLLFTLFAVLSFGLPAGAQTSIITVTSSASTGGTCPSATDCTLRAALTSAAALGFADIFFAPGVTNIVLGPGETLVFPATNITSVTGPITINGGGVTRVFDIPTGGFIFLDNVTVTNGAAAGSGAGIRNDGFLLADDLTVTNSTATAASGTEGGGGIANLSAGFLSLTGADISNNQVLGATANGGGIYSVGSTSMIDSIIATNVAGNAATTASAGGGVYQFGGSFSIQETTVEGNLLNSAAGGTRQGGGVYVNGAFTVDVFSSVIRGHNNATQSAFQGGGMWLSDTDVLIEDSSIVNNRVITGAAPGQGGGIYVQDTGSLFTPVAILQSDIRGNTSTGGGGGIYGFAGIDATLTNVTLDSNTAGAGGGGAILASNAPFALTNTTISSNTGPAITSVGSGNIEVKSSILDNAGESNCSGPIIIDTGYNIDSGSTCNFSQPTSLSATDPQLAALIGGFRPLAATSPALNVIPPGACTVTPGSTFSPNVPVTIDQRGISRPQQTLCEIGAYEQADPTLPATIIVSPLSSDEIFEGGFFDNTTYTISLTSEPTSPVTITLAPTPTGEATITPATLTFDQSNWFEPQTITITAIDDTVDEPVDPQPLTIRHTVTSGDVRYNGLNIQDVIVNIRDNDPVGGPTVFVNSAEVFEGATSEETNMTFTISLSAPAASEVQVNFTTSDGTALVGDQDYRPLTSFVRIPAGSTSANVNVVILGDDDIEGTEFFFFELTSVSGANLGSPTIGFGTILEDDDEDLVFEIENEDLPDAVVDQFYSFEFEIEGEGGPFTCEIEDEDLPDGIDFDEEDCLLSGTPTETGDFEFSFRVVDASGLRSNVLGFNLEVISEEDAVATAVPEPLTEGEVAATQQALSPEERRQQQLDALGPPTGQVIEVDGLSIRTGPYIGASLVSIAIPNRQYNIIGRNRLPGSDFTWYLIEYGNIDETPQQGWVSGRFLELSGNTTVIPVVGSVFDSLDGAPLTGVTGFSRINNNLYSRPSPQSTMLTRFTEGQPFFVLGRTVIDRRNQTYWLLVRMPDGQTGWIVYNAWIDIDGEITAIPQY